MPLDPALTLALVGLLGIGAQWLSWWLKLPSIVLLLLVGLLAGPVAGWLNPDELLGDLLFPLVSLGVAIILFEGSLTLNLHEIRGHGQVVSRLVTVGALVSWLVIGASAGWLLDLPWQISLLFGALVSVTGPTVIVPLLRTVRPKAELANILRWEGIIIDPLGALLAVLVFEFIVSGQRGHTAVVFAEVIVVGGVLGAAGALLLAFVLRRHLLPEYLHNVATLVLVLGVFAGSNALAHESGLLAVTVMGMLLANLRGVPIEDILHFKESLTVLLISGMFIILAARVEPAALLEPGFGALLLLCVVLFVARPLAVWVSTVGTPLDWRGRALLAWVAPRGIVAAAVSALFALRLDQLGYQQAELLVSLTFMVIVGTVVLQSLTARPLADWLGVSEPEARGVLIVGAGKAARAIGTTLMGRGYRALVTDTSWDNISAARMEGLDTYFGTAVSEHADRHLDLVGIGQMFAMSKRPALNALACMRFRNEFGAKAIFSVGTKGRSREGDRKLLSDRHQCARLFGDQATLAKLESLVSQGHEIRGTQLTDSFGLAELKNHHGQRALPLFALDPRDRLRVFSDRTEFQPGPGWTLFTLVPPAADTTDEAGQPS
jgi:CPA1 family monovalent cation:H+ antiporter